MNKFEELLNQHEIFKAVLYAKNLSLEDLYDCIVDYYKKHTNSFLWYTVLLELLLENETADLHNLIYQMLSYDIFPPCSEDVKLYHARKALEKSNKNDLDYPEYLCNLLRINYEPGKLVSDKEAEKIAKKVLELDPNNEFVMARLEEGMYK